MPECNCKTPGNLARDFIVAVGPDNKIAWYYRKDCPVHGLREVFPEKPAGDLPEPA